MVPNAPIRYGSGALYLGNIPEFPLAKVLKLPYGKISELPFRKVLALSFWKFQTA